jgi:prepilin-type N-terminal cleavage/methylation domain-containing protein
MKDYVKKFFGKILKKSRNRHGFTLLEILVVLVIMGFLIAMVAPRLAGISGGAVDTVCDTNQNRMVGYMSTYFEKTNRYPDSLTNIVAEGPAATTGGYQIPTVSNDDPSDGAETLAGEFGNRNNFKIHILDADEAAELKAMGIVNLYNLNDYSNSTIPTADQKAKTRPVKVAAGVGVAMVGTGHNGSAWESETNEQGWGEADWIGRIVMGLGPESGLVKSGIIANAAHCPGGLQNTDNAVYNDYNVTLPRLEATVARTDYGADFTDADAATDGIQLVTVAYDGSLADAYAVTATTGNADNLKRRTVNISETQEKWQYHTQCPEGHMYPEDDGEFWAIDINNNGAIAANP